MPAREAAALVAAIRDYAAAYEGDESKADILSALGTVAEAVSAEGAGGAESPGSREGAAAQAASREGMAANESPVDQDVPAEIGDQPKSFDAAATAAMDMMPSKKKKQTTP